MCANIYLLRRPESIEHDGQWVWVYGGEVYTTIIIRDRASLHQCYCRYSQQYMTRSNCVRWPQFEERGMQLLGVVNQPPPHDVWYFVCV